MCPVRSPNPKKLTISGRLIFSQASSPLNFHQLIANLFLLCLEGLHNLHLAHVMFLHRLRVYDGNVHNINPPGKNTMPRAKLMQIAIRSNIQSCKIIFIKLVLEHQKPLE